MEYGTIPNVSPRNAPRWREEGHMQRAAEFLLSWLTQREIKGMTAEIVQVNNLTPVVFAEIPATNDSKETVLLYGHYDKQPGFEGKWRAGLGPWAPVREGDLIYGRGMADDGYALFAAVGAIEAAERLGTHPRIVIIAEGSEESGSPHLPQYFDALKGRIGAPDVVVTLDDSARTSDRLWVNQSLRGLIEAYLTIETLGDRTMHSGLASGVVPSVSRILRMLIARIEDLETGRIMLPSAHAPDSEELRAHGERLVDSIGDVYLDDHQLPEGLRPMGKTAHEHIRGNLLAPALEMTGITGLPHAKDAGTVTVGRITAKLSLRIPAGVDPEALIVEMRQALETDPPYGARVKLEIIEKHAGWLAKPFSARLKTLVTDLSKEVYGNEPGFFGAGGSIPFINMMVERHPAAEHLSIGIIGNTTNEHGPNENMDVGRAKRLTLWLARFLAAY
jgi:acetylornithine deacetylase/succinyl-diaminopimelate desuccinylase-like protein